MPELWLRRTAHACAQLYSFRALPRSYIDHLRDANHTDQWGNTLHAAWTATGKGAPIPMAGSLGSLAGFLVADLDCDCLVGLSDLALLLASFGSDSESPGFLPAADLDGDFHVALPDLALLLSRFGDRCP